MDRKRASDFDQKLLDLYDDYAHGRIARRAFLEGAAKFAMGGITAEALLSSLSPNYAWAQQVAKDDPRLKTEYLEYASPKGAGKMRGYLVRPAASQGKLPAVVVIHENRGLNPYIEDVTRRLAVAGFLAFAPDALRALGIHPWPGNIRELQNRIQRAAIMADGKRVTAGDLELADAASSARPVTLKEARERLERELVEGALRRHAGKITAAAQELGISRPTFYELLEKLGLSNPH